MHLLIIVYVVHCDVECWFDPSFVDITSHCWKPINFFSEFLELYNDALGSYWDQRNVTMQMYLPVSYK